MRSIALVAFAVAGIGLTVLGYSSIEHSYALGIKDKYGGGVLFGKWFYLGAFLAWLTQVGWLFKSFRLKYLAVPFMFWVSVPTIFLIGGGIYDIWIR